MIYIMQDSRMISVKKITGLLILLTLFSFPVNSQEFKREKEVNISKLKAPEKALDIVDRFGVTRKKKWYKQTDFDTTSFEVKFKWNSHFYSIEFDTTGQIIDIEKLVKWAEIEDKHKKQLQELFDNRFDKYKLKKCQIQYSGDKDVIDAFFDSEEIPEQVTVRFEIELEGKESASWKKYEFLVSSAGIVERERIIVGRSTENLNY